MKGFWELLAAYPALGKLSGFLVGVLLIVVVLRLIRGSLSRYVKSENWYTAKKVLNVLGYVLVILLAGIIYSDRLGGFTVALGVAGAGIAFALQEVIASFAGWLAILVGDFYRTGDRVQLGGIRGDVIDQGILRTTLMELGEWVDGDLYNGRIVRVANSFVFKEPVYNYSADFPFLWDELKLPIAYGSDYSLTTRLLVETALEVVGDYTEKAGERWAEMTRKYRIEDASTEPVVTLEATDNWVEFTLRYVVDFRRRRSTRTQIFIRILERIGENSESVRISSATMDLTGIPPLQVTLNNPGNQGSE